MIPRERTAIPVPVEKLLRKVQYPMPELPEVEAARRGIAEQFLQQPIRAVDLRLPGSTAYAVDVSTSVGPSSVRVDEDPASAHRIEVRTEMGAVSIGRLP